MKLFFFLTTNSIYSSCHVLLVAKDSTVHSENPRYTSLTALFNSKLIYFGMQIRLENIDSLLTCLSRTDDAAGNSAYNRTCIMSITHSLTPRRRRKKQGSFYCFCPEFSGQETLCILSQATVAKTSLRSIVLNQKNP